MTKWVLRKYLYWDSVRNLTRGRLFFREGIKDEGRQIQLWGPLNYSTHMKTRKKRGRKSFSYLYVNKCTVTYVYMYIEKLLGMKLVTYIYKTDTLLLWGWL